MTTVPADPRTGNAESSIAQSPHIRIFAARLAHQMRTALQPGADMTLTVLLSYLEESTKGGAPVTAGQLADGVELAMRCGAKL